MSVSLNLLHMSESKKQKISHDKIKLEPSTNLFKHSERLLIVENDLCTKLDTLQFTSPIEYIYNPLQYARDLHSTFVKKYFESSTKKVMFLGMNPGPWGMCQTGIVFGEKNYVKDWLHITGSVSKPDKEHPKKKVFGLECHRSEISGKKFWEFFKRLCGTPENFFKHSYVHNLCPLAFVENSGKNITPPEIKDKKTRQLLYDFCYEALIKIIRDFNFEIIIGIGKFAEKSAAHALKTAGITNVKVFSIPHPSPRNAKNLKNWERTTFEILKEHNLLSEKDRIEKWMKVSLQFAEEALKNGEVPVGCIFIYQNEIIANGANTVNETKNATRHAEMNCIDTVLNWCKVKNFDSKKVFENIEVIVTVEPCIMCCAALYELNIKQIIYGCGNYRFGGCSSVFDVPKVYANSKCIVKSGVYPEEAINLLKKFYKGTNPNAPKSKVKKKKETDQIM